MKTRNKSILAILGLIISIGLIASYSGMRIPFITGKTNFIVVKNAFFNRSDILKPNAALLISDKNEIAIDEELFLDNPTYGHACGYHYSIEFWENTENLIKDVPFNQECEEFLRSNRKIQTKMKGYIKLLETKPTHYIYNLQLPVTTEPKEVLETFENSGFVLFFMTGTSKRHSSLTFSYNQTTPIKEKVDRSKWQEEQNENAKNATLKIKSIIDGIKNEESIIEQSDISFPTQSFGGGTIDHKGQVTLKFKNGTDLTKIKQIVIDNNGKIESENCPQDYFIQLLDSSDNIDLIKEKMGKYKFVTGVFEYPKIK